MMTIFKFKALMAGVAKAKRGTTAIEYGLIAALVAVVMAVGATTLGSNLSGKFTEVAGKVAPAAP